MKVLAIMSQDAIFIFSLHYKNLIFLFRYAEIVNVKLGDGSTRKGQVLEIAGKRAVV
jgi:hypothetical protein